MEIKIRYDEAFKTYDLNEIEAENFAMSLGVRNLSKLSKSKRQLLMQEIIDAEFNRPEYNNMHKFYRHKGNMPNISNDEQFYSYDQMDLLPDNRSNEYLSKAIKDNAIRKYVKEYFKNKPDYANVIISIYLDDLSIDEYAMLCRRDRTTISRRCQKALKLLKNDKTYKFLHELGGLVAI